MLKIENVKKLLIVVLAIALIALIQSPVLATTPTIITNTNSGTTSSGLNTIPTVNSLTSGTNTTTTPTTTNTTNTVSNTVKNTNTSTYTSSNLPKAGLDYSALLLIIACVGSGIYAYIKIRDYNNIKY